jgi:serine/threonine protein phosphatase PrpC
MLDLQFGQATDFGKVRTNNEDAMGSFIPASPEQALSHGYLFAVADGVGGYDLGEVASATAVSVLIEEFAKAHPGARLISLMPRLIQQANAAVHDCTLAQPTPGSGSMATTAGGLRAALRQGVSSPTWATPDAIWCAAAAPGRLPTTIRG